MTNLISTRWTCQNCGAAFISTPPDSGLCRDCTVTRLREIFHGPPRVVLSATQSDCLRDMLADAIAYRRADAAWCPRCQGSPLEDCGEHSLALSLIEAYKQLAGDLGEDIRDDS
jgi:hypothetical protein